MNNNYSIVIQWSDKDNCYVASLPEWSDYNVRGASYETALAKAQKTIAFLTESYLSQGQLLPEPKNFQIPSMAQSE